MKNVKTPFGILALMLALASCSNDDSATQNQLRIKANAVYSPTANRTVNGAAINENVTLSSFKVNIKEIEFEYAENDDNDDDDNFYNGEDEFELNGPFELDLLNQNSTVTTVSIPNGTYEEVEFELDKNTNPSAAMYDKSVEMKGMINGTPFVFWHSIEESFEIDYEDNNQNLVVNNNSYDVVISFDLNQVLSQVDLSTATDGDGDGIIEIGPNDTDGNQALANIIKNKIKDSCELDD